MSRLDNLVEKYKLGEIEFDVVLEETKPLIAKLSRRIGIRDWELDDYFQEGAIILFNCIDKYEENHTTSFTSYFSNNIKWKLFRIHNTQTLIRVPAWIAEKSGYQRFNFISNIQSNGEKDFNIFDLHLSENSFEELSLANVGLSEIVNHLNGIDKELILLLSRGYTQSEIARSWNMRITTLNGRYKRIQNRLRKMFMEEI